VRDLVLHRWEAEVAHLALTPVAEQAGHTDSFDCTSRPMMPCAGEALRR
jgi:hypothetical protein